MKRSERLSTPTKEGSAAFSQTLRAYRARAGITQLDLAELAGVSQCYIGKLERGQRLPSLPVLEQICKALGADIVDFARFMYPVVAGKDVETKDLLREARKHALSLADLLDQVCRGKKGHV